MFPSGHDSPKRHCSVPGNTASKFRRVCVLRWLRLGGGECVLLRGRCRAFVLLNVLFDALVMHLQTGILVGNGLVAKARAPFGRWMLLPMQDCNLGCTLDKNNLHVQPERPVMILRGDLTLVFVSINTVVIAHTGQHEPISSNLWAPGPGGLQCFLFY